MTRQMLVDLFGASSTAAIGGIAAILFLAFRAVPLSTGYWLAAVLGLSMFAAIASHRAQARKLETELRQLLGPAAPQEGKSGPDRPPPPVPAG
jgi:hypothetical protein